MRVLDITEVQLQWSDLDNLHVHERKDEKRIQGITHVSEVLKHVAIKHKIYTDEDRADDMPLRIMLGLAFEEMAARLYAGMDWQPGQVEWDGIVGSPDGLTTLRNDGINLRLNELAYYVPCVDEFKYTGKSQRVKGAKPRPDGSVDLKDIRTEWMWMQQGASYINILRRVWPSRYEKLNLCRFHICWKFGTYAWPMEERYVRYLVEYSDAELLGNWALLQANKGEIETNTR